MDLKQIEYFIRVAELGSFTRASIALDIAQPALSRQIRLLELELGQSLLLRNGRGVTTTEAGKVMLEQGRGVLHQVDRAREELGRVRGTLAGRVALGLPPSLSKLLTVSLVDAFSVRLPQASLSITEGLSATMQESLISGRLDIALLYNAAPTPEIDSVLLREEELFLVAPRQGKGAPKPISLRELAGLPLVIPSRPNAMRMLVEAELANLDLHPQITLEIDSVAAILDLVASGRGNAVLPMNAVGTSGMAEHFTAHPIVKPRLRSKLSLAVSAQRPTTLTQQSMLELIREMIGANATPARGKRSGATSGIYQSGSRGKPT
ncbi:MAG: LysR substrate-binding domain-containing protein [Pseudoxanthomonas sp.]